MEIELFHNEKSVFEYTSPCCPNVGDVVIGWNTEKLEEVSFKILTVVHHTRRDERGFSSLLCIFCDVTVL